MMSSNGFYSNWKKSQLLQIRARGKLYEVSPESMTEDYATSYLNAIIFKQRLQEYGNKVKIIDEVYITFMKIKDIDALCNLFDYITSGKNKPKINLHQNEWLDWLCIFKENTEHYKMLIESIRAYAYDLLLSTMGLTADLADNVMNGQGSTLIGYDPAIVAEKLYPNGDFSPLISRNIFSLHFSNFPLVNNPLVKYYFDTEAVTKLKQLAIISHENRHLSQSVRLRAIHSP